MRTSTLRRQRGRDDSKMERLEARISPAQKKLFQKAASIQGRTLTQFVVGSAQEAAKNVVQEYELITLSVRDRKVFVKALLNPSVPSQKLLRAAQQYETKVS